MWNMKFVPMNEWMNEASATTTKGWRQRYVH